MPQFVVLGEALIDVFAEKGIPLRAAKTLYPSPGGAPANVAVALARLGAEVGFIGKVGVDDYGAFLIDLLAEEGVSLLSDETQPVLPIPAEFLVLPAPFEVVAMSSGDQKNGPSSVLPTPEIFSSTVSAPVPVSAESAEDDF